MKCFKLDANFKDVTIYINNYYTVTYKVTIDRYISI